jgi:aspartyl-tRNA(Asn)/glutamyl-tRNA(Gln) amidotransferase subunit C
LELTRDNTPTPAHFDPAQALFAATFAMPLTLQDVSRIAHLARLELGEAEQESMRVQLNDFFRVVEQMSAVDTTGVEPLYTPLSAVHEVSLRLRADAVTEHDERAANLRSAPAVEGGLFLVPKVIE